MSSSVWSPQPGPQSDAIGATWCPELLYGGAAGGGKSDFLLGDFLQDVPRYGDAWRGIVFRRTYPELEELIARSTEIYLPTGAHWHETKRTWRWPNGATLKMRYAERETDKYRYQGHQYTWIGWDELTQWPSLSVYRYLRSRLRSAALVPTKRIRATANPGGPGHHDVRAYFIDPAPMGFAPITDEDTGLEHMFIPSRLSDNRILLANDPGYVARLKGLGSEALVRALLDGDWSVISGAFFNEFRPSLHVVQPMELPSHWLKFRAMDWGSARPFSVGWYAVSDGDLGRFPRGALIKYREWYGASAPNVGLRMTAEMVADGIAKREVGDRIAYGVIDPAAWAQDGGPSIAERMINRGVHFRAADNKRLPGWDQLRARLIGEDGRPMLYLFATCVHTIRTLPALQHDEDRPEDVDTEGEDHAGDETRYACMSRPYQAPRPKPAADQLAPPTLKQMFDEHLRRRAAARGGE